jgi:hypothetical protein
MRKVTRGRKNRNFQIAFQLAKSAEFLDWRDRSLLAPHKQRRLAQTPECMPYIDVEMPRQKRCRRVTRTSLVRRGVIDLHQLASDQRVVGVCVSEIAAQVGT